MRRVVSVFFILLSFQTNFVTASEAASFQEEEAKLVEKSFSGSVLIAHGEQVLYSKSFGYSNRERGTRFDEHTIFDIGSITKQFLAASIIKLSEQGQLSVEDELTKFFSDVPEDKKEINLHHLLTHTAGLPANLSGYQLYDIVDHKKLPSLIFQEKLYSEPGVRFQYSNIGYSLLARVVERVTSKNWEQYINETLLKPSGLESTGYRIPEFASDSLAINYGADQNAFQRLFSIEAESRSVGHSLSHLYNAPGDRWMEGAGGFMSTISDMHKWYMVMHSGKVLTKKSWETTFTPHAKEGNSSHYGYGWLITTAEQGTDLITHNGSNGYSFADFKYYPAENLFVFIATNDIDSYPEQIMKALNKRALKLLADKSARVPDEALISKM